MTLKSIFLSGCFVLLIINPWSISAPDKVQSNFTLNESDTLPGILEGNYSDFKEKSLSNEAYIKSRSYHLPDSVKGWNELKIKLRNEIIKNAGVTIYPGLPLDMRETATILMKGYSIKNVYFQTRPGIYATANIYIPDGKGPFPAVVHMIGHFGSGKIQRGDPQGVGHSLALNGYVCISIDPWGYGERTTIHGDFETHGSNLGASLMNIGETLMGIQVSDNIKCVDLLCSLPYVDSSKIGATGASGGGHQTMYLAAMYERIKAAVPVVSVGTYESLYPRGCICNMLLNGLTFTEEAGVLALIAPRAVKIINHNKDSSPAFYPSEMLRTYNEIKPVYEMLGVKKNITYQLFDLVHGYKSEDREAMIGWFDLHLKGIGTGVPKKEIPFEFLPPEKLMVFTKGKRDPMIVTTEEYCKKRGTELKNTLLNIKSIDPAEKKKELKRILGMQEKLNLKKTHSFSAINGWDRIGLETTNGIMIPLLMRTSSLRSKDFIIVCNPEGKRKIESEIIDEYLKKGWGIVITEMSCTGELIPGPSSDYKLQQQTMARSELWLGKTTLGEWANELDLVVKYIRSSYKPDKISIDGSKEAGLASLFLSATENNVNSLTLRNVPISYLFDNRKTVDFFSMGIHIPGFLNWGDISLAAALSGKNIIFINPLTMSGTPVDKSSLEVYKKEFEKLRKLCRQEGKTIFI